MNQIQERTEIMNNTTVYYLGVSHWMSEVIQDRLLEIDPDVICAEANPEKGFTDRMDQKTIQSHLLVHGPPVVMIDSSNRPSRKEFLDRFGGDMLQKVKKSSGRDEIFQIDSEVADILIDKREQNAMIPRIRETTSFQSINSVAVVIGSEHLEGICGLNQDFD